MALIKNIHQMRSIKSREQLLIEENVFVSKGTRFHVPEIITQSLAVVERPNRPRRTKIICTLSEQTGSYESMLNLYKEGMNIIRVNMAYTSKKI